MSWATRHIEALKAGITVQFRPHGNSMRPKIESGQLCTVEPLRDRRPIVGDIVLCRVNGNQYLHRVTAVQGDRFQISNNHGYVNGWVGIGCIFGLLVKVED